MGVRCPQGHSCVLQLLDNKQTAAAANGDCTTREQLLQLPLLSNWLGVNAADSGCRCHARGQPMLGCHLSQMGQLQLSSTRGQLMQLSLLTNGAAAVAAGGGGGRRRPLAAVIRSTPSASLLGSR